VGGGSCEHAARVVIGGHVHVNVPLDEVEVGLGVPAVAGAGDDGAGEHVVLEHVVQADGRR